MRSGLFPWRTNAVGHSRPPRLMTSTAICVGAVVLMDDRVLLVRQAAGHELEGQWTIPWGRIASGESPADAVVRETREEGGVSAGIAGLLGVQELPSPWDGQIGIVYLCRHLGGEPRPDDHETDAAAYFSAPEMGALREPIEPLSRWLGLRVLQGDYTSIPENSNSPFAPSLGFL